MLRDGPNGVSLFFYALMSAMSDLTIRDRDGSVCFVSVLGDFVSNLIG